MVLRQGMRNKSVQELQTLLVSNGKCADLGSIDGYFGPRTAIAVLRTQRALGLEPDGLVGPATLDALRGGTVKALWSIAEYAPMVTVPYLSQRDNQYISSSACNVTSVAMCLAAAGVPVQAADGRQLEDDLYLELKTKEAQEFMARNAAWAVGKYPANQVHVMLQWLLHSYYGMSVYPKAATASALNAEIIRKAIRDFRQPVIVSTRLTGSGHIVVITGITENGDLVINDPWGDPYTGYSVSTDGRSRVLPSSFIWPKITRAGGVLGVVMDELVLAKDVPSKRMTVAVDIDGVVKEYHGEDSDTNYTPIPGAINALRGLHDGSATVGGVDLVFFTARFDTDALHTWLSNMLGFPVLVTNNKPVADVYVDDRAYRFEGDWAKATDDIKSLLQHKPWWGAA